jgi:hypothetical protein
MSTTTFTHKGTQYSITAYKSNVEVSWNHEAGQDYDYMSILWDSVCPTLEDKEDFDSEVDYIEDLASYYLGKLPTEVYAEAVRYAFSCQIADVLYSSSEEF